MAALKTAALMLARFLLCLALIACVWIVSISYRIGAFDFGVPFMTFHRGGDMADSDWLFLAACLGLLIGLLGLYRSGRISTVLMVVVSLLAIFAVDHAWSVSGAVDEYKGVPEQILRPALAPLLIGPLAFLFPARREAENWVLAGCWAVLVLTIFLIGSHVFDLQGMIGPTYMKDVFLCLLACEILRQVRRWWQAYGDDILLGLEPVE